MKERNTRHEKKRKRKKMKKERDRQERKENQKKKSDYTSLAGNRTRDPCHTSHLPAHTHLHAEANSYPSKNISLDLYTLPFYETLP
jgi:hypothetical protein